MKDQPRDDARFPFKFSPLMIVLCAAGFILSAACIALTSWQLAAFLRGSDISSVYDWLKFALLYLVSLLLIVLLAAMLIRSQYVLTESSLIMQFGLIRQKYELGKIVSVHLFRGSGRLAVYFDDFKTNYVFIVVKASLYDDFIRELTSRNEKIAFTFSSPEEEAEVKKKPRK